MDPTLSSSRPAPHWPPPPSGWRRPPGGTFQSGLCRWPAMTEVTLGLYRPLTSSSWSHNNNNRGHTRPLQTTDLQQLVSIPEAACVAHRAVRQYGAYVVVRSDLHSVLHVHCPLQTDAQASSHSPLGHTANLQTAESDKLAKPLSSE